MGSAPIGLKLISILLLIRVLCIGNSFSWDAVEHELVPLCDAENVQVEVHNLYYGGCSLQQHAEFLLRDTAAYSHRVCTNAEPRIVADTISLKQALQNGTYDYISLQQASHDSGIKSTYEPWLSLLIDSVRAYQPNAQLCWMQTWAYSQDAKHPAFPRYQSNQQVMWDSIQACTKYVQQIVNGKWLNGKLVLIPCGEAIQRARNTQLGDSFCRDGYHLSPVGWYTAAAVWYEILTGKDVRFNRYQPESLTEEQRKIAQKSAHRAVKK